MRTETIRALAITVALASCAPAPVPFVPVVDAYGTDAFRTDMGSITLFDSGPQDTGSFDAPDTNSDANLPDANLPDSGIMGLTLDGLLSEPVWTANASNPPMTNSTAANSPFGGESLSRFVYARDANYLYLGFEGSIVSGDAIIVYVDLGVTGRDVMLTGSGLGDATNTVNAVASLMITGNAFFQPEFVWGSAELAARVVHTDTRLGWRRLAQVGLFGPVSSGTSSACSMTGCETQISWTALGVAANAPVQVVARLGRPNVAFASNQLFPSSDTGAPEMIATTITVAP